MLDKILQKIKSEMEPKKAPILILKNYPTIEGKIEELKKLAEAKDEAVKAIQKTFGEKAKSTWREIEKELIFLNETKGGEGLTFENGILYKYVEDKEQGEESE